MMKLKEFDKVLLKDGDTAYIVEIFNDGEAYLADVDRVSGTETELVYPENIEKKVAPNYYVRRET